MKKTAAWLAVHALEQLGVKFTFGIPGVQNTEFYDELNKSEMITPVLYVAPDDKRIARVSIVSLFEQPRFMDAEGNPLQLA
mgnify:CR=1 FL=1